MNDDLMLPTLPKPHYPQWSHSNEHHAYIATQMREYAKKAVEAERAVRKTATYTCGVCCVSMQMEATLD